MPEAPTGALRQVPLHAQHAALGARFTRFAGWEMPLEYVGIVREHVAVRERVGLFDVSHMGEIAVRGPDAAGVCQELTTNDVARLVPGQAQYSLLTSPRGGVLDDVMVYRRGEEDFLMCVNAANTAKDYAWVEERARGRAEVTDLSAELVLLALQGPGAAEVLGRLTRGDGVTGLHRFHAAEARVCGVQVFVSRTGYTGEDGFELFCPAAAATRVWSPLAEAVSAAGGVPAGLGARDTLRLEAGLPLYGQELDETTTPLEAGLENVVRLDKGHFMGREALLAQRERGVARRLVGLVLQPGGIGRAGCAVWRGEEVGGRVTSGTMAPFLRRAIALAYVPAQWSRAGTALAVEVRGRRVAAEVVARPFYRRGSGLRRIG